VKRILIAYDGSPSAEAAIDDLGNAGLPTQLEAAVMCVADVWMPPALSNGSPAPQLFPEAVRKARDRAFQAVSEARAVAERGAGRIRELFPKWEVTPLACGDSPSWAVVQKAHDWSADLVVVGAHSHSALERVFLGSVAHRAMAEAHCSVRVARLCVGVRRKELSIMIGVDGSSDSENAVREVVRRRWPADARFSLISVIDTRMQTLTAWPGLAADRRAQQHFQDASDWISRVVDRLGGELRQGGLAVETHIFEGEPKKVLLKKAHKWKADCLFVGAHGLQHGRRLFLGSLATAVATRAPCSVEIVRVSTRADYENRP